MHHRICKYNAIRSLKIGSAKRSLKYDWLYRNNVFITELPNDVSFRLFVSHEIHSSTSIGGVIIV